MQVSSLFALFDFLKLCDTLLELPMDSLCAIHFRLIVVSCRNWRVSATWLLSPLGNLKRVIKRVCPRKLVNKMNEHQFPSTLFLNLSHFSWRTRQGTRLRGKAAVRWASHFSLCQSCLQVIFALRLAALRPLGGVMFHQERRTLPKRRGGTKRIEYVWLYSHLSVVVWHVCGAEAP